MMNSMDKEEIVKVMSDQLRVRAQHYSVDLTSKDINDFRNFVDVMLSNYTDDRHLQDMTRE